TSAGMHSAPPRDAAASTPSTTTAAAVNERPLYSMRVTPPPALRESAVASSTSVPGVRRSQGIAGDFRVLRRQLEGFREHHPVHGLALRRAVRPQALVPLDLLDQNAEPARSGAARRAA